MFLDRSFIVACSHTTSVLHTYFLIDNTMSKQIPVIHSSAIILDQESGQGTRMCSDTDTRGGPGRGTLVIQDQCESLGKYSSFHSSNYKCETRRFCRVCWDVKEDGDVLVSPCLCSGVSLSWYIIFFENIVIWVWIHRIDS